jgi:hypothetical protein
MPPVVPLWRCKPGTSIVVIRQFSFAKILRFGTAASEAVEILTQTWLRLAFLEKDEAGFFSPQGPSHRYSSGFSEQVLQVMRHLAGSISGALVMTRSIEGAYSSVIFHSRQRAQRYLTDSLSELANDIRRRERMQKVRDHTWQCASEDHPDEGDDEAW